MQDDSIPPYPIIQEDILDGTHNYLQPFRKRNLSTLRYTRYGNDVFYKLNKLFHRDIVSELNKVAIKKGQNVVEKDVMYLYDTIEELVRQFFKVLQPLVTSKHYI